MSRCRWGLRPKSPDLILYSAAALQPLPQKSQAVRDLSRTRLRRETTRNEPAQTLPQPQAKPAEQCRESGSRPQKSETATKIRIKESRGNSIVKFAAREPKSRKETVPIQNIAASGVKNYSKQSADDAPPHNRPIPTLNSFEEDDDNTLRRTDLFDEVGSK